jgi:hypothetical protein
MFSNLNPNGGGREETLHPGSFYLTILDAGG